MKTTKRAILYTRVSTDEQANKGYSLDAQKEQLENYCYNENIEVAEFYIEDHSAKSFNRPEFQKLLKYAKANSKNIDYLFIVSWDRFSRNTSEAYEMLSIFKKLNIEVQAIMQPIDFKVPQSKIILSVYLTLPEVDNDIRSEKITTGIRKAKKFGRWTSFAPIGYSNKRDEANRPIIVPNEQADILKWGFEEVAKNYRPMDSIRRDLNKQGIKVCKSAFTRLLRNPIYIGKIFLKANENEPEQLYDGLHKPIISDELFYEVQMIILGRNKKLNKQRTFKDREELPLRGVLSCSNCGKHVTGSASKSRNGSKHFYYHCEHCKKERFRADIANSEMEELLSTIQFQDDLTKLYERLTLDDAKSNNVVENEKNEQRTKEVNKLENRLNEIYTSFIEGEISPKDYSEVKQRIESRLGELKYEIQQINKQKSTFTERINSIINILPNVLEWYRNSTLQEKRELIGSIFPERFIFTKNEIRTTRIDPIVAEILSKTEGFREGIKKQAKYKLRLLRWVVPPGLEPGTT